MIYLNYAIIACIIVMIVWAAYRYVRVIQNYNAKDFLEQEEQEYTIDFFVKEVSKAFSRTLKRGIGDDNLSRNEFIQKRKRISLMRQALKDASNGKASAIKTVKNNIKTLLCDARYGLDDDTIDKLIPFSEPAKIPSQYKVEIILYMYNLEYEDYGFDRFMEEWRLTEKHEYKGESRYIVTKEDIDYIYYAIFAVDAQDTIECSLKKRHLDFDDKLEILTQVIFERYIGPGAISMLIPTSVDEIDAGVSGVSKGSYAVKNREKDVPYTYESIWITYHGLNIYMQCMTFGSQEELVRVCNNIYKYEAKEVLSENKGSILNTMMDGSRILVTRPGFSNSYSFFLRKFDSTPTLEPKCLLTDKNSVIAIKMLKWIIKGQCNTLITGSQGAGKSTTLKSLVRFIDSAFTLRVQEKTAELNLSDAYPYKNIVSFQETESMSEQDGLELQKKTNGTVNIYGEIATAQQTSYLIQTATVASLFALGTHHANTTDALIDALSNDLLRCSICNNKRDAVEMVARILDIDCHMERDENTGGKRYIGHITQILSVEREPYPSQKGNYTPEERVALDTPEYFHRMTNPVQANTQDLVVWEPLCDQYGNVLLDEGGNKIGQYRLVNLPTKEKIAEIKQKLSDEEKTEFMRDLYMMQRLSDGDESEEVKQWEHSA